MTELADRFADLRTEIELVSLIKALELCDQTTDGLRYEAMT